jgi:hypothetical protein
MTQQGHVHAAERLRRGRHGEAGLRDLARHAEALLHLPAGEAVHFLAARTPAPGRRRGAGRGGAG